MMSMIESFLTLEPFVTRSFESGPVLLGEQTAFLL